MLILKTYKNSVNLQEIKSIFFCKFADWFAIYIFINMEIQQMLPISGPNRHILHTYDNTYVSYNYIYYIIGFLFQHVPIFDDTSVLINFCHQGEMCM